MFLKERSGPDMKNKKIHILAIKISKAE